MTEGHLLGRCTRVVVGLRMAAVVLAQLASGCGIVSLTPDVGASMTLPDGVAHQDADSVDAGQTDQSAIDEGSTDTNSVDAGSEVGQGPDAGLPETLTDTSGAMPPAATWVEHWFEHNQTLDRIASNEDVVLYFDRDVVREGTDWMLPFLTSAWHYTQVTYGDFKPGGTGDGRLHAVFHQGRYLGCHVGYYNEALHDYRNVTDCGAGPWAGPNLVYPHFDLLYYMAIIVEHTNNHFFKSPAANLWNTHFREFFVYDGLLAAGLTSEAQAATDAFMAGSDPYPRAGTRWFRDWFFPLWRDHGHAQVMVKFFKLVAQYTPATMNIAEMVHFMSGAAGVNLKAQGMAAFGPEVSDTALARARIGYPKITYPEP